MKKTSSFFLNVFPLDCESEGNRERNAQKLKWNLTLSIIRHRKIKIVLGIDSRIKFYCPSFDSFWFWNHISRVNGYQNKKKTYGNSPEDNYTWHLIREKGAAMLCRNTADSHRAHL